MSFDMVDLTGGSDHDEGPDTKLQSELSIVTDKIAKVRLQIAQLQVCHKSIEKTMYL